MSNDGIPKEFEPFDLEFSPRIVGYGKIEVASFSSENTYTVDLENQTCTCPNFVEDRLPYAPPDHLGRWCKHLVEVLNECGALEELDEWRTAMLSHGFGGVLSV